MKKSFRFSPSLSSSCLLLLLCCCYAMIKSGAAATGDGIVRLVNRFRRRGKICEVDMSPLLRNAFHELRSIVIQDPQNEDSSKTKTYTFDNEDPDNDDHFYGQDKETGATVTIVKSYDEDTGTETFYGSLLTTDDDDNHNKVCRITPGYEGSSNAEATAIVKCEDASAFPNNHNDNPIPQPLLSITDYDYYSSTTGSSSSQFSTTTMDNNKPVVLDVLIAWSRDSECMNYYGFSRCNPTSTTTNSMKALIKLAVEQTTIAFQQSGIPAVARLVHAYRLAGYEERNFRGRDIFDTTLDLLMEGGEGIYADVHAKREQYGADIVSLFIDDKCGRGFIGPIKSRMFSVVGWSCATTTYALTHEIGHNLGARHDRGTDNACARTYGSNYGYRDPGGRFHTVMAYPCKEGQCDLHSSGRGRDCQRLLRFSNPNIEIDYKGETNLATGTRQNDNAQKLMTSVEIAANYFPTKVVDVGGRNNPSGGSGLPENLSKNNTCRDDDKFRTFLFRRDCQYIAKWPAFRCKVMIGRDGRFAKRACPATCGQCAAI